MIEAHIFNSLLNEGLKDNFWFTVLDFVNGWVAPAFLFVAGFVFYLSIERNIDNIKKFKHDFWRRLGRIFLILLAGYSLHLPYFSLYKTIHASHNNLIEFYNVDILQCIAAGLLFLYLFRIIINSEKIFHYFVLSVNILIIFLTPFIWKIDFSTFMPVFIANYFNAMYGSNFPLFPWTAYIFSGVIVSRYFFQSKENENENNFIKIILITGLIFIIISHILFSGFMPFDYGRVRANPIYFFQRIGYIFVLFFFCWFYAKNEKSNINFILELSRESLLIYWLHLQILYREVINGESFVSFVNKGFNAFECLLTFLIITFIMVIISKIWGGFKLRHKSYSSILTLLVVIISLLFFLLI